MKLIKTQNNTRFGRLVKFLGLGFKHIGFLNEHTKTYYTWNFDLRKRTGRYFVLDVDTAKKSAITWEEYDCSVSEERIKKLQGRFHCNEASDIILGKRYEWDKKYPFYIRYGFTIIKIFITLILFVLFYFLGVNEVPETVEECIDRFGFDKIEIIEE